MELNVQSKEDITGRQKSLPPYDKLKFLLHGGLEDVHLLFQLLPILSLQVRLNYLSHFNLHAIFLVTCLFCSKHVHCFGIDFYTSILLDLGPEFFPVILDDLSTSSQQRNESTSSRLVGTGQFRTLSRCMSDGFKPSSFPGSLEVR